MDEGPTTQILTYRELFTIFLKAGLAFGGGPGMLAVLEDELVSKRGVIRRDDFLAAYSIGRIVPSGPVTALAVAYGYRFGGLFGTLVTLVALVLPAFLLTIGLTITYGYLKDGPLLTVFPITILPAAIAFIVAAALRLGKHVLRPSVDLLLAAGAFIGATAFNLNPALLFVLGGVVGVVVFRRGEGAET